MNTRSGLSTAVAAPEWWVAALALFTSLFAQIEFAHYLTLRGAEVSAVLVTVVWYALRGNAVNAAVFGLIAGLCEDIFSAQTGVAWTVATPLAALFVNRLSRWFFADSIPAVAVVVIAATLLRRMFFWVVMALQGYPTGYARLHLHEALWEAVINALLAAVLILIARAGESRSA